MPTPIPQPLPPLVVNQADIPETVQIDPGHWGSAFKPLTPALYEIAAAHAWPLLGSGSYIHAVGQRKFWLDLNERMINGQPCLEPRVEPVPVRMSLLPAPFTGSIF